MTADICPVVVVAVENFGGVFGCRTSLYAQRDGGE